MVALLASRPTSPSLVKVCHQSTEAFFDDAFARLRSTESAGFGPDIETRVEAAHEEAFIRLALKDMDWPSMLPAVDALYAWAREHHRHPSDALRQVLIADQRAANPGDLVCDLSLPLK